MKLIKIFGIFIISVLLLSTVSAFSPKDYIDSNLHSGNTFDPSDNSYKPSDSHTADNSYGEFNGVDTSDSSDTPSTVDYSGNNYNGFKGNPLSGSSTENSIDNKGLSCDGGSTPKERVHNTLDCSVPSGSDTPPAAGGSSDGGSSDGGSDSFDGLFWKKQDYNIPDFGKSDNDGSDTPDDGNTFIGWFWNGRRLNLPDLGGSEKTPNGNQKDLPYQDLSLDSVRIRDAQGEQVDFNELTTGETYFATVNLENLGSAKVENARVVLSITGLYSYTTVLFDMNGKESRTMSVSDGFNFESAGAYTLKIDAFPTEDGSFQDNNALSINLIVSDHTQDNTPAATYTEEDANLYIDLAKDKVSKAREAIDKAEKALEQDITVYFDQRDIDSAWDDYKDSRDYKNEAKDYLALKDYDTAVDKSKRSIDISKGVISDLYFNWELLDNNSDTSDDSAVITAAPVSVVETGKTSTESQKGDDLVDIKTTQTKKDDKPVENMHDNLHDALIFAGLSSGILIVLVFNVILAVKLFKKK